MNTPKAGNVHYGRYEHKDFGSSMKFIVVLYADAATDKVITCIATKVPIDKNRTPGCQPKTQRFFLPAGQEYFEFDTYLELLRFKEFSYQQFTAIDFAFSFQPETFARIMECLRRFADDISSDLLPLLTQ